ncbi:hypothetical protein CM49_04315 [Paenibacillus sp. P1XP2]|nr:hypothetical protein CM49_04315 [Paenibacillus sp. P1XP2]
MKKEWVTVKEHRGYKIQILNGAGAGDCLDYKAVPALYSRPEGSTYPTIGAAMEAIDEDSKTTRPNENKKILAEDGERFLVRIDGQINLGGTTFNTWHHEIWNDREKYIAGIHQEGNEIYCSNLAGFTDESALDMFNQGTCSYRSQEELM